MSNGRNESGCTGFQILETVVGYFDQQTHAQMMKKVLFTSCARDAHVRRMKKKVCWLAIESDSQKLVDTLKLVDVFYRFQPCYACAGRNTQQTIEFSI